MRRVKELLSIEREVFFVIILLMGLISSIICITWNKDIINQIFFGDTNDYFMDFYNSMYHANNDPYALKSIYPPLAYVIYKCFSIFVPNSVLHQSGFAIRDSQGGNIAFMIYNVIMMSTLVLSIYYYKKGSVLKRSIFSTLILFSGAFLFTFERGNIILLSLIFLMLFIFCKDHRNKKIREMSLICLAISASLKVYPAILGLILIKEKRYKEAIRAVIYGILIFFIPFIFFGGIDQIAKLLEGIFLTGGMFAESGYGYLVDVSNSVRAILHGALNIDSEITNTVCQIVSVICLVFGLAILPVMNNKWKEVTLLISIMVLVPSFSGTYTLIFYLIPLIMFLDNKEKEKQDYKYLIFFIFIFACIPSFSVGEGVRPISGNQLIQILGVTGMYACLIIEGIYSYVIKLKDL